MKILLLILTFLISGCAAKKMAVRNADFLLQRQIEKRLPLYSNQKKLLEKDVNRFLNDQKAFAKEAIPVITSIELDTEKVELEYGYLNALYKKLALNFSKLMSKYMAQLDDKQQKKFEATLKAENQALKKSKSDDHLEKVYDRFETLFGSITKKQKKILKNYQKYFDERHAFKLNRRQKLHAKFSEIYKMDVSFQSRINYFYEAFAEYQNSYPEADMDKEILRNIIPTLSIEQKEDFEDVTNEIKDIINYYLDIHY